MKRTIIATLLMTIIAMSPAMMDAQVRFGIKGGLAVSKLSFDKSMFQAKNKTGFTAGVQLDLKLPLGFGIDGSVLYSHRNDAFSLEQTTYRRGYIEIPVHLRYGISLVGLNNFIVPYAFTGPNFAFLCDESKNITWENRSMVTSWDVGFGIELLKHVQIQACYGIGITEAFKKVGINEEGTVISGKDRCWTITAAYLF